MKRKRRFWTDAERAIVREHYRAKGAPAVARMLRRTTKAVHQEARTLGLCIPQRFRAPDMVAFVRSKNGAGWSDSEIAEARRCDRHAVSHLRKSLGLPSNARGERFKAKIRDGTRRQCSEWGVPNLAALRGKVFRDRAREAGWPEDLRLRAVQMLNVLWERGPQTRRQLCDAIGMKWLGSRKSLVSNDPGGTYLTYLIKRGLVISLGRIGTVHGKGKGRSVQVYSLPLFINRGVA